jgi:NarL family two-component system response regulator LiaR
VSNYIRIAVIDDHIKVHMSIEAALVAFEDLKVIAHGSNGWEALQLCLDYHPDIILMDVIMPGMNGIEATKAIHAQVPEIKILALSSFEDEDAVRAMLQAGAVGYVLKTAPIDELAQAIRTAYTGTSVFSPEVVHILLDQNRPSQDYDLTLRQREVLRLLVKGQNNTEIAEALSISLSTTKFHVSSILTKLGVNNRVEAVALAVEKKLVDRPGKKSTE